MRRLKSLGTREDGAVAVIAHGGIIKEMLRAMPGIASNAESFLYNGSMSRVDIEHRKIRVVYLNRIDFIPSHLITI